MRRGDAFPSNYVGKDDLLDGPITVTVDKIAKAEIQGDDNTSSDKPVIYFVGGNAKPLICNTTNWMCMEDAFGPESDNWGGKAIELFVDPTVMFGTKRVGGVRIRIPGGNGLGLLSYEDAQALCEGVGIDLEQMKTMLKSKGLVGYNKAKATPLVREMVALETSGQGGDVPDDSSIPF